jgi:hypothetical protein
VLKTLSFVVDPYGFFAAQKRRYGDPYTLRTVTGPLVVTGKPELARAIFSADPDNYEPYSVALIAPFLGERSLLMTSGEQHRRDPSSSRRPSMGRACAPTAAPSSTPRAPRRAHGARDGEGLCNRRRPRSHSK